jgi:transcriptional regulator with XRE-family HTH domain
LFKTLNIHHCPLTIHPLNQLIMKKTAQTFSKKQLLRYHAEADLAYLVKLNRIGHGWSTEELSFLIGRSANYINTRENLVRNSQFTVEDMVFIAMAFEMSATEMIMHNPGEFRQFQFQTTVVQKGNIIFHEIWRIDSQSKYMLCRLYEFPKKSDLEKEKDFSNSPAIHSPFTGIAQKCTKKVLPHYW